MEQVTYRQFPRPSPLPRRRGYARLGTRLVATALLLSFNLFSRNAEAEIALRKTLRELTTNTTRRTAPLRGVRIAAALQLEFDVVKPEVENVLLCTEAR